MIIGSVWTLLEIKIIFVNYGIPAKPHGEFGIKELILVMGGLGYLGGRISEHLVSLGNKVRISTSRENFHIHKSLSSCEVIKVDYSDDSSIDRVFKGVSCVIYLAALNSKSCENNPESALIVNVLGVLKALNFAKKNQVKDFLYFSTAHVYGKSAHKKMHELICPNPETHYSMTHQMAESYVLKYNKHNEFHTTVFRLTNVVGPPVSMTSDCWTLFVNDLCRKIASGKVAFVNSNKEITRDFIAMKDILKAVEYFFYSAGVALSGEVINISSGNSITLGDMSSLILSRSKKVLEYKAKIQFSDKFDNEKSDKNLVYSNKKALDLGFTIENNLVEEIDDLLIQCVKWFSKNAH